MLATLGGVAVLVTGIGIGLWQRTPTGRPNAPAPTSTAAATPRKPSNTPAPTASSSFIEDLGSGVKLELVRVPGGSFQMGSNNGSDDEKPVHQVTVSPFAIGKYEVTQAQWQAVMGHNPSNFKGDDLPVENVSWDDAQEFCRTLSQRTAQSYRLPTETEWEYACRAGPTGDYAGNLDAMAWYDKNSENKTHAVGQKQPNAWGLYDMHGNVWEWCADWYEGSYYGQSAAADPPGPTSGSLRVGRGGGWVNTAAGCRSAFRYASSPGNRGGNLGFRLVRSAR